MTITYKVIINSVEHAVTPLLKLTLKGQKEGVNYSRELANSVTFIGADYALINAAFSDCSKIVFKIIKDGSLYYQGYFKRTDCKTDEDMCVMRVTVKTDDCNDTFKKDYDKEISPYHGITVKPSKAYFGDLETIDIVVQ